MKNIIALLATIGVSMTAFAAASMTKSDFQNSDIFKYTIVKSAELAFVDELSDQEIYQVIYEVETHNCAPYGEGDFCEWETLCEYVLVDTSTASMSAPNLSCDMNLEDIIGDEKLQEL